MRIDLNGISNDVVARTLAEALVELGLGKDALATALNGRFVPAALRTETMLRDGDRVEVLAPMQGG